MPQTKKLLVPFDPARPKWNPNEFLIPTFGEGRLVLTGLKHGKEYEFGRMVYIGEAISENDLFAKLVDSGAAIRNVDETLARLSSYVDQLQTLAIGNVVRIISPTDGRPVGLELVSKTPSGAKS